MDEQPLPPARLRAPILTWRPGDEADRAVGEAVVLHLRSAAGALGAAGPDLDEYDCRELLMCLDRSLKAVVVEACYERFLHLFGHLYALRESPEPRHAERTLTALADAVEVGLWEW
ncbi:hypothetical protein [Glycomyces tarimensis]